MQKASHTEIHREMKTVDTDDIFGNSGVHHCCNLFGDGCRNLPLVPFHLSAQTEENARRIEELIHDDGRLKICKFVDFRAVSTTAHKLDMQKFQLCTFQNSWQTTSEIKSFD